MWRSMIFIVAAMLASPCSAPAGEAPLVVLVERDPWLMVLGSDSPSVVVYADGQVIMRNTRESGYVKGNLSEAALQALLSKIAPTSILAMNDSYETTPVTDQPTNELHVWVDGRHKLVSVYGDIRHQADERQKAPEHFVRVFDALNSMTIENPQKWIPEQIQLLIWPFEYSPEKPLPWPEGWPSFQQARARGSRELYEIFLPSDQYPRLCELLNSLQPKQAVLLENRKWTISYRFPFPKEGEWSK